jgi:hypothetical protein
LCQGREAQHRPPRGDETELAGFDETLYVSTGVSKSALADLLGGYRAVRQASIGLFSGLSTAAWLRRGTVNGYRASTRGLAFHIAAHELHYLRVLRERYLPEVGQNRRHPGGEAIGRLLCVRADSSDGRYASGRRIRTGFGRWAADSAWSAETISGTIGRRA